MFTEEPKINTRKIDCSRPMTDLDDEAQAKIEEMMYNQRQKQLGLPQSHEQVSSLERKEKSSVNAIHKNNISKRHYFIQAVVLSK